MIKLPVFAVIGEAYSFVWSKRRQFWTIVIPAVIVVSIMTAIQLSSFMVFGDGTDVDAETEPGLRMLFGGSLLASALTLLNWLVYVVVFVMYSVAWHRILLVPDESKLVREAYGWHRRQSKFLFAYIKIFLAMMLLLIVPILLLSFGGTFSLDFLGIWFFPLAVGAFWFYARISVLLPAAAVDNYLTVKEAYNFSAKNGWRLFWILLLVALPISIASLPVSYGFTYLLEALGGSGILTTILIASLVNQFFAFIGIAVGVSALSISYKRLLAQTDQAMIERFD